MRAAPTFGAEVQQVRRSHLTNVVRDKAPAIHVRFGSAKVTGDRSCGRAWKMDWTVSIYVRDDNDATADPLVVEAIKRLDPDVPYTNGADVELQSIDADTEIADGDAQRVDIRGTVKFVTGQWAIDEASQ